ncbi:hypothetical protein D3C80_1520960 [compost metagenome]
MEVMRTQQPAQGFLLRRGQAQFLGILRVFVIGNRRAVDLIRCVVGVAGGLPANVVIGTDRGQGVIAQLPVQGQRSAVVIEFGVFIHVDVDIAPAGTFITNVVVAPNSE